MGNLFPCGLCFSPRRGTLVSSYHHKDVLVRVHSYPQGAVHVLDGCSSYESRWGYDVGFTIAVAALVGERLSPSTWWSILYHIIPGHRIKLDGRGIVCFSVMPV